MKLEPSQVRQVLRGDKTQVRVLIPRSSSIRLMPPVRVKPGVVFSIRGDEPCRVVCTDVLWTFAGVLTRKDAIAEGYRSEDELKAWWVGRYDGQVDDPIARFDTFHATRPVSVLRFTLDTSDPGRYLRAAVGRGPGQGDYTTTPSLGMRDEGQALDKSVQKWFSADAEDRRMGLPGRREEALRRRGKSLSTRISQAVRVADAQDMEVAAQLERISSEVARLESLRRKKAA